MSRFPPYSASMAFRTCKVPARWPRPCSPTTPRSGRCPARPSSARKVLEGMVRAVAEKGYAAATVADAVRLARVSRGTFYALFDSKEACLASAYRLGCEVLEGRVSAAVREAVDWREELRLGMRAYLARAGGGPRLRPRLPARVAGRGSRAPGRPSRASSPAIARPSPARGRPCRPTTPCSSWRSASTSSPAAACAPAGASPISRTPWWAAPCGSPQRRSHGPDLRRARDGLPGRGARVVRRQRPRRPSPCGDEDAHYAWRARLPAPARRRRPGGGPLARGVRRPRRDADGVGDLLRGARPLGRPAARERARPAARRPDDHDLGHRRSRRSATSSRSSPRTRSGARASPSPTPARTSRRSRRGRSRTATSGSSRGRRSGPPARSTRSGACSSPARTRRSRSTRG